MARAQGGGGGDDGREAEPHGERSGPSHTGNRVEPEVGEDLPEHGGGAKRGREGQADAEHDAQRISKDAREPLRHLRCCLAVCFGYRGPESALLRPFPRSPESHGRLRGQCEASLGRVRHQEGGAGHLAGLGPRSLRPPGSLQGSVAALPSLGLAGGLAQGAGCWRHREAERGCVPRSLQGHGSRLGTQGLGTLLPADVA
mmetsp:Transcript_32294/g.68753  ORF Transcript_32294/g.68753 Transcript_32294/m.68753 type:complete len:200 (-) Transcript_32294:1136-1735(-)